MYAVFHGDRKYDVEYILLNNSWRNNLQDGAATCSISLEMLSSLMRGFLSPWIFP